MALEIVISKDWDANSSIRKDSVRHTAKFSGRSREKSLIKDLIIRRSGASILIAGERGVGKTALVHEALFEINETKITPQLLIVPVNAAQFVVNESAEGKETESLNSKRILSTIIRRLHSTLISRGVPLSQNLLADANELNEMASAAEWSHMQSSSGENAKEFVRDSSLSAAFNGKDWLVATSATAICVSAALASHFPNNWLTLLPSIAPIASSITWHATHSNKNSTKSKDETLRHSLRDNSLSNMEFQFENLIALLSKTFRIVFVIDEMDKIHADEVASALKQLKHLVTSTDATFIFIAETSLYTKCVEEREKSGRRPPDYTYFTSKIYISRATSADAESYLDSILVDQNCSDLEWSRLKGALLFESQNDFYDLKNYVHNRITAFTLDGHPILENFLTIEDIQMARWHRLITILLQGLYLGKNPLNWRENDKLWNALFDHAIQIRGKFKSEIIMDPIEQDVFGELKRDFNQLLFSVGGFQKQMQPTRNGETQKIGWKFTGSIPEDPPAKYDEPTEYERIYKVVFDDAMKIGHIFNNVRLRRTQGGQPTDFYYFVTNFESFASFFSEINLPIVGIYREHTAAISGIYSKTPGQRQNREQITEKKRALDEQLKNLWEKSPEAICSFIQKQFPQHEFARDIDPYGTPTTLKIAPVLRNIIGNVRTRFIVLALKNETPRIIVATGLAEALHRITNDLKKLRKTNLVISVENLPTIKDDSDGFLTLPFDQPEALEEMLSKMLDDLTVYLKGPHPKPKTD